MFLSVRAMRAEQMTSDQPNLNNSSCVKTSPASASARTDPELMGMHFAHARAMEVAAAQAETDTDASTRGSVLVVEDERVARHALVLLLTSCGYSAMAVGSAEDALRLLDRTPPPAVALIDLDLPGMSGADLIRRLQSKEPAIFPVLITAAGAERVNQTLCDRSVTYFQKPLSFDRLLRLLDEKQSAQSLH
jgi:CheY-like chemotaxis protein